MSWQTMLHTFNILKNGIMWDLLSGIGFIEIIHSLELINYVATQQNFSLNLANSAVPVV